MTLIIIGLIIGVIIFFTAFVYVLREIWKIK